MAIEPNTARRREWNAAFENLTKLNHRLSQAQPDERGQLEQLIADQQDDLLDTSAPSFTAVRQKLELLWEAELHGLDQSSEEKRLILEDIEDLIAEAAALIS
jgi:hypothetical protein